MPGRETAFPPKSDNRHPKSAILALIQTSVMRIFIIILLLSGLVSCRFGWGERVTGNGRITTDERRVSNFNSVDVSGDIAVHIRQDPAAGVRVETDENLMQYVEVFTSGSQLVIRTKEGYNLDPSKDIIAYVSAPSLNSIEVSGSSDVMGEGVIKGTSELSLSTSGSGSIYMEVEAEKVSVHASGAGNVNLKGHARDFDGSASGSGDLKCFDLATDNTELDLSGSGSAEVNVSRQLDVHVSGSADVKYKGSPNVSKSISGSGTVKRVE